MTKEFLLPNCGIVSAPQIPLVPPGMLGLLITVL